MPHVPTGKDRRIHSRRFDRVHDGANRYHRIGLNTAAARDFNRHNPGADHRGGFNHVGAVDDNHSADHNNDHVYNHEDAARSSSRGNRPCRRRSWGCFIR